MPESKNTHVVEGKLLQVSEKFFKGKDNAFEIRYILIETDEGDYSQKIKMECAGKNVNAVKEEWIGSDIEIKFNLRGFEWEGKNYVGLTVWRANPLSAMESTLYQSEPSSGGSKSDEIPF